MLFHKSSFYVLVDVSVFGGFPWFYYLLSFKFVQFLFFFCWGFKGQVRWPEGPPHLALNPPYLFSVFCVFCFCFRRTKTDFSPENVFCLFLNVSLCLFLAFCLTCLYHSLFLFFGLLLVSSFLSLSFLSCFLLVSVFLFSFLSISFLSFLAVFLSLFRVFFVFRSRFLVCYMSANIT